GSERTIPRPRTYTRVFAVPRSTAMSRPPKPVRYVKKPMGAERPSCEGKRGTGESKGRGRLPAPSADECTEGHSGDGSRRRGSRREIAGKEDLRRELEQGGDGQPHDAQIIPLDRGHERRA